MAWQISFKIATVTFKMHENQQPFVRSSDNAGFISRTDYTHTQCMLDMELAANASKAILAQIHDRTTQ